MADLFGREVAINIGGTLIRTRVGSEGVVPILKAAFRVVRTNKKEPNTTEITVYNLSPENRVKFQERELVTTIEAGYAGNTSQIFQGELTFSQNKLDGRDWITSIQAGDASKPFRTARINTSIKGPAKIGDVLQTAADALGINLGNVQDKVSNGSIRGVLTEFTNGIVMSGKAEVQFDKIVKSMGYSWSIQDGQLQLLEPTETIGQDAVLLTPGTGLVGTPEAGEKGFIKVRSLLQPDLLPGRKIQVQSKNDDVSGFFRVEKVTFLGDTWGNDWYADVEAKPL